MKKLFLLIGLVVLFFAQSSYANPGTFKGPQTELKWKVRDYSILKGTGKIEVFYKKSFPTLWVEIDLNQYKCFDFKSKTYFNIDKCESVYLLIVNQIVSKKKSQKFGKQHLNNIVKDICEDAIIVDKNKKINNALPILGRNNTGFTIKCPKVLANRKMIQEEKKLAEQEAIKQEQQAIIQEQEAEAQEVVDAQQKKIETCEAYSFKKGSEPFGQCIFKLMELDLEYAKLENEQLRLEAQAEQAKLNNQVALSQSLAAQAQASNRDKALRIQQFGLAMQGIANSFQTPSSQINPRITCRKVGFEMRCW